MLLFVRSAWSARNLCEFCDVRVQPYGFVVIPGFIFGFDSDTEAVFQETLDVIETTGMLSNPVQTPLEDA